MEDQEVENSDDCGEEILTGRSEKMRGRVRSIPQKLRDSAYEITPETESNSKLWHLQSFELSGSYNYYCLVHIHISGSVVVICSQNGKMHTLKIKDLSREDEEPLGDLVYGDDVIMQYRGKPYAVKFVKYNGNSIK